MKVTIWYYPKEHALDQDISLMLSASLKALNDLAEGNQTQDAQKLRTQMRKALRRKK